jgi:hypothetical protein
MAEDIKTTNYKKNVERLTAELKKELDPLAKQLDPILAELKAMSPKSGKSLSMRPSPDDKKKKDELQKKAEEIKKKMETAMNTFRRDLATITDNSEVPKPQLTKLGAWVKDVIEKKGLPITKNITLSAEDLEFDFSKMKLTGGTVTLEIEF